MPRLSVHMAARNSEATIERAIRSTLAALPKDAELVVADDASTDGTADRVLAIVDPRLRLLRRSRSEGIGPARQHLLDTTDSEFVATMDSDDVCLPWRFRTQLPRLERSVDLCFTSVVSFREAAGRVSRVRPGLPLRIDARALPLHLLVMNMLHNAAMAARRATLVEAGGYRQVLGEDHDLWLRVITVGGKVERLGVPGTAYRYHVNQFSGQPGFTARALAEETLRESYRAFVRAKFSVEPTWLDALWSSESGTPRMAIELAPLMELLHREGAKLGPVQRGLLGRTTRHVAARLPKGSPP